MTRYTALMLALPLVLASTAVEAKTIRVPRDAPNLAAAVAKAGSGDTIAVGTGRWCGAVIDKSLEIVGHGHAVIVGGSACSTQTPSVDGYRAGLVLDTALASGTTIRHLSFEGTKADAPDLWALAYAVYARDARGGKVNRVRIEHNRVVGTLEAFSNHGGDDWVVRHNDIRGVHARGAFGGHGVSFTATSPAVRPVRGEVAHNRIQVVGSRPEGTNAGVYLAGVDGPEVDHNRVKAVGQGATAVLVTAARIAVAPPPMPGAPPPGGAPGSPPPPGAATAGAPPPPPPSSAIEVASANVKAAMNDGRTSPYVVVVTGSNDQNKNGMSLKRNRGTMLIEGEEIADPDGPRDFAKRGNSHDDEDDD